MSLSSLVPERSQKKARGQQLYDLNPSPEKKRSSLPAQISALEDEDLDIVLETSQMQPDDDLPAEIPDSLDVSVPIEAFGDDDIVEAPTSPEVSLHDVTSATKKRRGRPSKSGDIVASTVAQEEGAEAVVSETATAPEDDAISVPKKGRGRPWKSGESLALQESEDGTAAVRAGAREEVSAAPKKRLGRPRKSGETIASRPSDTGFAGVDEGFREDVLREMQDHTQQVVIATNPKRKVRPVRDIVTAHNDVPSNQGRPKKVKKIKGPKMISPDEVEFEEDVHPLSVTPRQDVPQMVQKNARQEAREARRQERQQNTQPRGTSHPRVTIPIRSTQSRSTRSQAEPADAPDSSATRVPTAAIERKGKAAQRIARNTRDAIVSSAAESAKHRKKSRKIHLSFQDYAPPAEANDEDDADEREDENAAQAPGELDDSGRTNESCRDTAHEAEAESTGQEEDVEMDDEAVSEQENDDTSADGVRLPALDAVFKFADGEEGAGKCSIGLAKTIRRTCDRAYDILSGEDCSIDGVGACRDSLIRRLASARTDIQGDNRFEFKHDAFAYLFRALAMVFNAMYDRLQHAEHQVCASLKAMSILHSFVCEILRFKDAMDVWKVKVQGHAKGDRLIRNVETHLVVPLRVVEKDFKKQLGVLQQAEQERQSQIKMQRHQENQEREMLKNEEVLRTGRDRRKRWQDLHIARMQFEPDLYRRRSLRFVEPPHVLETDANGNTFERVPFFGERSAPPPSSTLSRSRQWSQEQETVLLDALQSSACKFASAISSPGVY